MMKPRCLEDKFLGWSATGELLPCCWYDNPNKEYIKDLLDEKFRISYDNTVEDVLNSLNWSIEIGGLSKLIEISENNLSLVNDWVENSNNFEFLAK